MELLKTYRQRHCERRAWDKSPAKKSDDDTGRRHCDCEARSRKQSRLSRLYLDCFVSRNEEVTRFVIISYGHNKK